MHINREETADSFMIADTDKMPLDFAVLMGTSPQAHSYMPATLADCNWADTSGGVDMGPFDCRRVASFPMVNKHVPKPSNLKVRSYSESAGLNWSPSCQLSVEDLKREISNMVLASVSNGRKKETSVRLLGSLNGHTTPTTTTATISEQEEEDYSSARKSPKKKVVFADDRGYQLVTIRLMTEPSDVPPRVNSAILRALSTLSCSIGDNEKTKTYWKLGFIQPASEYLQFRTKLEENCVALENVVLKNEQSKLTGTIKVKNISFEKEVFVRISDNNWQSYIDRPATYIPGAHGDLYDTFSFDCVVPMDDDLHQQLAFCVCFRAGPAENRREFWDSNGGTNFLLSSERKKMDAVNQLLIDDFQPPSCNDVLASVNFKNWTEFASWRHVDTEAPYW